MKKLKNIIMIAAAVLFLLVPRAFAGSNAATMLVSAKVLPFVSRTLMHQAGEVTITAWDIKRGYIDMKRGTVLEVRTNSKNGYLLSFERENGPYKEIWVIEKERTTVLSGSGGLIHHPYPGTTRVETRELGYRFLLSDDAVPGSYPWPLKVDVVLN